jgi:hypothetical protein
MASGVRHSVQLLMVAAVLASLHLTSGEGVEQVLTEEEFKQNFDQSSDLQSARTQSWWSELWQRRQAATGDNATNATNATAGE